MTRCTSFRPFLGEVIAVVGSCEALGNWSYQKAVTLHPLGDERYVKHYICCETVTYILIHFKVS